MAAKGSIAKENVISKIQAAFGKDFVGIVDKKVYVWGYENGERVQIALSMTCPKTPVEVAGQTYTSSNTSSDVLDFEAPTPIQQVEITQEEKDNIAALMERLGL